MDTIMLVLSVAALCLSGCTLLIALRLLRMQKTQGASDASAKLRQEIIGELRASRQETGQSVTQTVASLGQVLTENASRATETQDKRLADLREHMARSLEALQTSTVAAITQLDSRQQATLGQHEQRLEAMRQTVESRLRSIQQDNNQKLDEMRATVDEKLQKTLQDRIGQSFSLVSQRLEEVYKGLGEMQALAVGVGDLKRVLSNVKTRGILGELQLGAILEQILSPDQYETNVATRPGAREVVEYAVRLPGDGERPIFLPIDAKYPGDTYEKLILAYETGRQDEVDTAATALERVIKQMARDIHDKYIEPPYTTDFGILFLPVEGLYAEAVRRGLVETLQREYKVNLAGPTTMAALLNSLQMGFRTLAIQKRSGQVWEVLGAVKTEFSRFSDVLKQTQTRLDQARGELDKLVGTRTRQIERKLRDVVSLDETQTRALLNDVE